MHYVGNRLAVGSFLLACLQFFNEAGRTCFRPRAMFLCILTTLVLSANHPSSAGLPVVCFLITLSVQGQSCHRPHNRTNIDEADAAAAFGGRYSICPADLALLVMLFSTPFTSQYVALYPSYRLALLLVDIFICLVYVYVRDRFIVCCRSKCVLFHVLN